MKVGDYVRTKYGITQYKEYDTQYGEKILAMPIHDMTQGFFANVEDIIKSSPNIIDLIEVGDYVNSHKVIYTIGDIYKEVYVEYGNMSELLEIKPEQIKSIVTKEQFESMKYKIESVIGE